MLAWGKWVSLALMTEGQRPPSQYWWGPNCWLHESGLKMGQDYSKPSTRHEDKWDITVWIQEHQVHAKEERS